MKLDYNQYALYVMYLALIVLSAGGAYLHIYPIDVAQQILLVVVGHFMGVLTPSPQQKGVPSQ